MLPPNPRSRTSPYAVWRGGCQGCCCIGANSPRGPSSGQYNGHVGFCEVTVQCKQETILVLRERVGKAVAEIQRKPQARVRRGLGLSCRGWDEPDASFKMDRLQRHLKDTPLVLALDEIDQPSPKERNSILYNLSEMQNVGLICICNSRQFLFDLDQRIKSRLNVTQIEFKPYSVSDLVYILTLRAETALVPRTWGKALLERISEMAEGDARVAIQTLKNAAYYAEKDCATGIKLEHVEKAWKDARFIKKTYLLNKLTADHRLLFDIIKSRKETLSNQLWEEYLSEARSREIPPIASRTYSEYVNKLRDLGLIKTERARVRGKVRIFRVVE